MTLDTQRAIRKKIKELRTQLTTQEQYHASQAAARRLINSPLFLRSDAIVCYLAVQNELDTAPIIREIWRRKKRCYLPVLAPTPHYHRLWFALFTPDTPLKKNRFGIFEPVVSARQRYRLSALDLVITPLVAFDATCHRIGMGGGFYDRTFAFLARRTHWRQPRLVGYAYELQKIDTLPVNPWDIPLTSIITDQQLYTSDTRVR